MCSLVGAKILFSEVSEFQGKSITAIFNLKSLQLLLKFIYILFVGIIYSMYKKNQVKYTRLT